VHNFRDIQSNARYAASARYNEKGKREWTGVGREERRDGTERKRDTPPCLSPRISCVGWVFCAGRRPENFRVCFRSREIAGNFWRTSWRAGEGNRGGGEGGVRIPFPSQKPNILVKREKKMK